MIEIVPVDQFVQRLLHAPALAVARGELLGPEPLDTGHVHPRPPPVGGCPGAQPPLLLAVRAANRARTGAERAKPRMNGTRAASKAATAQGTFT
jgi:hypothetical protein